LPILSDYYFYITPLRQHSKRKIQYKRTKRKNHTPTTTHIHQMMP